MKEKCDVLQDDLQQPWGTDVHGTAIGSLTVTDSLSDVEASGSAAKHTSAVAPKYGCIISSL